MMLTRPSLLVVLASLAAPALFAQPSPQYNIKNSDPPIGSNIRRNITEGSHIPINKTYSEMSSEEREAVHRYYEKIETGDEPPFPTEGLRPVHSAVAKAQQKLLVTGKLVLLASVGPDGNVAEVKAIGSPSPEMVQAAASIVALTKFKPALCKGTPCKMDFPFIFNFKVE
jgi:Gram-negative bacterial TonB protein C-terminal